MLAMADMKEAIGFFIEVLGFELLWEMTPRVRANKVGRFVTEGRPCTFGRCGNGRYLEEAAWSRSVVWRALRLSVSAAFMIVG